MQLTSADPTAAEVTSSQEREAIIRSVSLLCPNWNASLVRVERYLPGGYRNRNFCISYGAERFVLRLPAAQTGADFNRENNRLEALAKLFPMVDDVTLDIASVVACDPLSGTLLTRWCDAPLLADCPGMSAESLGTYLAVLHRGLRDLPRSATTVVVAADQLIQQIQIDLATTVGSTSAAGALFQDLPQSSQATVPCHLDLNPWNLLVDRQNWTTLDWETLAYGDPMFDLVTLCDGYLQEHGLDQHVEDFALSALLAYSDNRSSMLPMRIVEPGEALGKARILYQWREFSWAAAQLARGNTRSEVLAQRDFFAEKLRQQGYKPPLIDPIE